MDSILEDLLLAVGACRVTLRQDMPGEYAFPVTHEALAPGVPSLVDERTVDLRTQPVVRELMRGHQVVQLLVVHHPLQTQPLGVQDFATQRQDGLRGVVAALLGAAAGAVGTPRSWTDDEVAACTSTADRVAQLL